MPRQSRAIYTTEPSKDFLAIPAARTTADTVLTWPVYEGKFGHNALIDVLFAPVGRNLGNDTTHGSDSFLVPGGLMPPNEDSIPLLVDVFLENVHVSKLMSKRIGSYPRLHVGDYLSHMLTYISIDIRPRTPSWMLSNW